MSIKIIEITNLSHCFASGFQGLNNINLTVRTGELVVIAGENGSGKTTLLRHLNGLLQPTRGSVKIDGEEVYKNLARSRQLVGMVFQNADSQIVGETVWDDVAFGPENLSLERAEINKRVNQALKTTQLLDFSDKQPYLLSGGEKRRLAIAAVLAMNPRILVLDEPFSSLDYPGVKQVLKQILFLHKCGHTILMTTHDIEKIIPHAQRLIVMKAGKIVLDGLPQNLMADLEPFGIRTPCAFRMGVPAESWLN
jgi:biotin transport system ATP-binding protein